MSRRRRMRERSRGSGCMLSFCTDPRTLCPLGRFSEPSWSWEQRGVKGRGSGLSGDQIRLRFESSAIPSSVLHHLQLSFLVSVAKFALHVTVTVPRLHFKRTIGSFEAVGVRAVTVEFVDMSQDWHDGGGSFAVVAWTGCLRPRPRTSTHQQHL